MVKVLICGAAGGIGQPLSLLLKQSPHISHLALFDIVNTPGVAADLGHINTKSKVTAHLGNAGAEEAYTGADIIVIPAGVPRKPGMTRDDLFKINAGIIRDLATHAAKYSPKAFMLIISNPVNSTVPIVSEVFKKYGCYDPRRIFGITTLDIVRASTFISQVVPSLDPATTGVPVVGGHSGVTIIPLTSQVPGAESLTQKQIEALTNRIQFGGDEVVKAKGGLGSATLSMAYAAARFTFALLDAAFNGVKGLTEYTYVNLDADKAVGEIVKDEVGGLEYFSVKVDLGPDGVQSFSSLGALSPYEKQLVEAAIPELRGNIVKGASFITSEGKL